MVACLEEGRLLEPYVEESADEAADSELGLRRVRATPEGREKRTLIDNAK